MSKYTIGSTQNLYSLMRLLDTDESGEITLKFSNESEVYKNSLNMKTLKKLAEARGKTIKFEVENAAHKDYIEAVNNDTIEYNDEEIDLESAGITNAAVASGSIFSRMFGMFKKNSKNAEMTEAIIEDDGYQTVDPAYVEEDDGGSPEYAAPTNTGRRKLIKAVVIAALAVLFLGGSAWAFFWYVPMATVKITVDAKGLIKLVDVKASASQKEVSADTMTIPAFSVETTETDSQSIPTTGTKQSGDLANGEITITNKTDKDVKIKKGEKIKLISDDKEGLLFKTTEEVEVPKASETVGPPAGTVYGTKKVKIEAEVFGDKYNLDKDEKFEIGNYDTDEVVGANEDKIDGGSTKDIKVVAQADLDTLKRTTEEFMKDKVDKALSRKLVDGQVLQESSVAFTTDTAKFSNQLDEEAENLTLDMTMTGKVLAYDKDSLDELMKSVIKTVVPESFNLNQDNPEYEVAATSATGDVVNLQVKLKSSITPRLDEDKIKKDLSGMALDEAKKYLDDLNDVKAFEITVSPKLPGVFLRMPERPQNISIEIKN